MKRSSFSNSLGHGQDLDSPGTRPVAHLHVALCLKTTARTMNLIQHPELLERIASSYALGTLRVLLDCVLDEAKAAVRLLARRAH